MQVSVTRERHTYLLPAQSLILGSFPDEIFLIIASNFNFKTLKSFELTCKRFRLIANNWVLTVPMQQLNLQLGLCTSNKIRYCLEAKLMRYFQDTIQTFSIEEWKAKEINVSFATSPLQLRELIQYDLFFRKEKSFLAEWLWTIFGTAPPKLLSQPALLKEIVNKKTKTIGENLIAGIIGFHSGMPNWVKFLKYAYHTKNGYIRSMVHIFLHRQVFPIAEEQAKKNEYKLMEKFIFIFKFNIRIFQKTKAYPPALAWKARFYLDNNNQDKANRAIAKAIAAYNESPPPRILEIAGRIYFASKRFEDANQAFDKACIGGSRKTSYTVFMETIQTKLFLKKYEEVEKLVEQSSKNLGCTVLLDAALAKFHLRKLNEADILLDLALTKKKGKISFRRLIRIAKIKFKIGKFQEACAFFSEANLNYPMSMNAELLSQAAKAFQKAGLNYEAMVYSKKAEEKRALSKKT